MRCSQRHRPAVAGRQRGVLILAATMPDRTDSMNNVARRQSVTAGELGIAGRAAAECSTLSQQLGARRAVDRAVDSTTAQQRSVRRIDDSIDAQCRDIGDDDLEGRRADRSRK